LEKIMANCLTLSQCTLWDLALEPSSYTSWQTLAVMVWRCYGPPQNKEIWRKSIVLVTASEILNEALGYSYMCDSFLPH
jgi:hypothetical protein